MTHWFIPHSSGARAVNQLRMTPLVHFSSTGARTVFGIHLHPSAITYLDSMPSPSPIRIAGAGPSGLAAAIALARGGRDVEVHEAKADVGMRFIGDLQIIEGSSEREAVPD